MVYTDGIHLLADSLEELHAFALKIGLGRHWFHNNSRHPHYDLMKSAKNREIMLTRALDAGASLVTSRKLIEIINENRGNTETSQ